MAETTADVKRDIELTRQRMSSTLAQLEHKLNLSQMVRDNPWPAIGAAFGAGLLLSGSRADVKAAAAAVTATKGASSRMGNALDDVVATLMSGLGGALHERIDGLVAELKHVIGAPTDGAGGDGASNGRAASWSSYGGSEVGSAGASAPASRAD